MEAADWIETTTGMRERQDRNNADNEISSTDQAASHFRYDYSVF